MIIIKKYLKAVCGLYQMAKTAAKNAYHVQQIAEKNPGAVFSSGAVIIGEGEIIVGDDSYIEDGVIFDMRHGGEVVLGNHVTLRRGAILSPYGGRILMGDHCGVNHNSIIYGHGGFSAGDFVRIAANCVIIPANHSIAIEDTPIHKQPLTKRGIKMGNDIWIGAGVTILDGTEIEDGAVIAAGAVVSGNVKRNWIAGGVPARFIQERK